VASFFPFHATYWLNGHSFIERELTKAGIGFRKDDNAFLAVDDVAALQSAADRLSPAIIRKQLDYWKRIKGSIEPGKLADFVVLDEDFLKADPKRIEQMKVLMTVVGGKIVFSR
jgi:hypothetical protein